MGSLNMYWGEGMLTTLSVSEDRPLEEPKRTQRLVRHLLFCGVLRPRELMVYSIQCPPL